MTTHPTDTPLGTPRCDAQLVEPYTDGSMRSIKPPLTVGDVAYVPAGFAYTLETELNEAKAQLSELTNGKRAIIPHTREHARSLYAVAVACMKTFGDDPEAAINDLRALLRQKDEALREAIEEARTLDANTDPLVDTILAPALALTPKSPTP
jgi:hypothetical protein